MKLDDHPNAVRYPILIYSNHCFSGINLSLRSCSHYHEVIFYSHILYHLLLSRDLFFLAISIVDLSRFFYQLRPLCNRKFLYHLYSRFFLFIPTILPFFLAYIAANCILSVSLEKNFHLTMLVMVLPLPPLR